MNLFEVNKSSIDVISEGAFGGTYFRDIIFTRVLMASGIVKVGKNLNFQMILIKSCMRVIIMMLK